VLNKQLTSIKEQANREKAQEHSLNFNAIIQQNGQSGGEETP
jgi:hypothetical protein